MDCADFLIGKQPTFSEILEQVLNTDCHEPLLNGTGRSAGIADRRMKGRAELAPSAETLMLTDRENDLRVQNRV